MPISFPSSPSVDDIYTYNGAKYIWDGVKWVSGGQNAYIVQGEDAVLGATQVASLNSGQLAGFRNRIINGYFKVWQRGEPVTITTSAPFVADRWESRNPSNSGGTVTHTRLDGAQSRSLRLTTSGTTGYQFIQQYIEKQNCLDLSGEEVTLSLTCSRSTVRARVSVYDSSGTRSTVFDDTVAPVSLGNDRYSWTFTMGTIGTTTGENNDAGIQIILYPDGLNTLNGDTDFSEVQLEPGPVATPFEHRPIGTELALCQRYYARYTMQVESPGKTDVWHHGMRVTPTATALSGGATPFPKSPDYTVMGSAASTQNGTVEFDAEL